MKKDGQNQRFLTSHFTARLVSCGRVLIYHWILNSNFFKGKKSLQKILTKINMIILQTLQLFLKDHYKICI